MLTWFSPARKITQVLVPGASPACLRKVPSLSAVTLACSRPCVLVLTSFDCLEVRWQLKRVNSYYCAYQQTAFTTRTTSPSVIFDPIAESTSPPTRTRLPERRNISAAQLPLVFTTLLSAGLIRCRRPLTRRKAAGNYSNSLEIAERLSMSL